MLLYQNRNLQNVSLLFELRRDLDGIVKISIWQTNDNGERQKVKSHFIHYLPHFYLHLVVWTTACLCLSCKSQSEQPIKCFWWACSFFDGQHIDLRWFNLFWKQYGHIIVFCMWPCQHKASLIISAFWNIVRNSLWNIIFETKFLQTEIQKITN